LKQTWLLKIAALCLYSIMEKNGGQLL